MNRFSHGGDVYSRRIEHDFSANINPLGIPGEVVQAASRALLDCAKYPDPCCRALAEALSRREGIPPERIVCGNGAADLIYRIVSAMRPDFQRVRESAHGTRLRNPEAYAESR